MLGEGEGLELLGVFFTVMLGLGVMVMLGTSKVSVCSIALANAAAFLSPAKNDNQADESTTFIRDLCLW